MKVEILCDKCNARYFTECELASDLMELKCSKCGNPDVWFGDITSDEETEDIVLGKGGCKQK